MGSLGFGPAVAAKKSYFTGVAQGFVATAFVQILRNGFYVLRLRQQVDGRSLADESQRLWKEFPNGWMRGNVAHLLRNLVSSAVMGVFRSEVLPSFESYPPLLRIFALQSAGVVLSYPLMTLQTRMVVADTDTNYPDLFFDHIAPHPNESGSEGESSLEWQHAAQYGTTLLGTLYAGLLPFVAYLGVQILGDEFLVRTRPELFASVMMSDRMWQYAVRLAVRLTFHPLSTISVNLQSGKYGSITHCVRELYRERGVAGFWDGWFAEVCTFPWEVLRVNLYERLRR